MQFEMPTLFGGPSADYLIFSGVVILGTVAWVWSQRGRGVLSEARAPGAKSDGVSSAGGVVNGEGKSEGLTTENNSWVGLFRNWSNSIVSRSFRLIVTAVLKPVDFIVSVFGSVAPGRAESRNQTAVGTVARVRLAAHAAAAAPSRTAAVPGMVRAVQAAEATPLSNDVQWDKLTARIRRSIRSAHTAEGCHEAAWRQLDAVDYALLSLREDLRSVVLEEDCLRDEGIEAQLPARVPARAGQRVRTAVSARRRRDVAGIVRAVEAGRHKGARANVAA